MVRSFVKNPQDPHRPYQGDFIAQEWVRHWNGGWVNGNQWGVTLAFAPQPQYVPLNTKT